jgi:hypothetical protein
MVMSELDPFDLLTPEDRLHPSFAAVREARGYAPARATMRIAFNRMGDRDGNFVQQLQTHGFDARVWELYLHETFAELGYVIDRHHDRPDLVLSKGRLQWSLEATTANPCGTASPSPPPADPDSHRRFVEGELPVRLGSALYSKLRRSYWQLPWVAGRPFVLAVQCFAVEGSLGFTDNSLVDLCLGLRTHGSVDDTGRLRVWTEPIAEHIGESKTIPSHLFAAEGAENISAVMWSNSGTIAKFARRGYQAGLDTARIKMHRVGYRHVRHPDAVLPARFSYRVGDRWESWAEGLVVTHNPRALYRLPDDAIPGAVHHHVVGDQVHSSMPVFAPYLSNTAIIVSI